MHVYECVLTRGHMAVGKRQVTLCMTFSERELIPSYNRLQDRYGKLLHRYLSCLGDHQSTGAGGDATVLKGGVCVCVCLLEKMFSFFVISVTHGRCTISHDFLKHVEIINSISKTQEKVSCEKRE